MLHIESRVQIVCFPVCGSCFFVVVFYAVKIT